MGGGGSAFSVDVPGLLAALTEQFPDPLLCVRELVQNAADAGARRIEVDVAFDAARGLARLSVRDDGRGMGPSEVEGYLTIGLSQKDPSRDRGRFGIGKLSPYALGFERMVVETSDGRATHRLSFDPEGAGAIERTEAAAPSGTAVHVYRRAGREEAEALAERVFAIAQDSCGGLPIPLYVNGVCANRDLALGTRYSVAVRTPEARGSLGIAHEPEHRLLGGGIVLESGAPLFGPEIAYLLDGPHLAPTLSRNSVRRDRAFEALLQGVQAFLLRLEEEAARMLTRRVRELAGRGEPVERALDLDDRAALDWLRARLVDPEAEPSRAVRSAPLLETADGGLVSAEALRRLRRRLPVSRVPRSPEELSGFGDHAVPVLLLYPEVEAFLERERLEILELEHDDDGSEVSLAALEPGERALLERPGRPPSPAPSRASGGRWSGPIAGVLLTLRRRWRRLGRALRHPIDFWVARGWVGRLAGPDGQGSFDGPARLDLDGVRLGLVELITAGGEPAEARLLVAREDRVLLNRHHPTVRALSRIADTDPGRAHYLLDLLLATDPLVAASCDPRQVEWELVGRAGRVLGEGPRRAEGT